MTGFRYYPFVLLILLTACFEYNPNQIILSNNERNITKKNIEYIKRTPAPETLRFAFMGDSQRFYDEVDRFVDHVNQHEDLSFVLHAGDISDFGLSKEFKWIHDVMNSLRVPYLTVVGNHDLLANGFKVYQRMYGDLNYSFDYGNYRFVMINTNSREYGFNGKVPDLQWLADQLNNNPQGKEIIVIGHVPPFDGDFDKNLEGAYTTMLADNPKVKASLYGHAHRFVDKEYYKDGVRYFVTTSMQKRGYALVTLSPGDDIDIAVINF